MYKIIGISKNSVKQHKYLKKNLIILTFVWIHFVNLHFVWGFQVEAELQLWQELEAVLLCDMPMFPFRLLFSFWCCCQALRSRDWLVKSSLNLVMCCCCQRGRVLSVGGAKGFFGLLPDFFFALCFWVQPVVPLPPAQVLTFAAKWPPPPSLPSASFHPISVWRSSPHFGSSWAHLLIWQKALNFIFISEYVPCFLQLLPHAVSTLLLLCALDFYPFSSFSCCVMSQLDLTHLAESFSLFGSLKCSFYFLDFLPVSSRSATPSPSKTAAGRAGRDRFAGESYTVLGKDDLPNPN